MIASTKPCAICNSQTSTVTYSGCDHDFRTGEDAKYVNDDEYRRWPPQDFAQFNEADEEERKEAIKWHRFICASWIKRQSTHFLFRPNHSLPLPQGKQRRWIGLIQTHH